jgi:hypothetical protein
VIHFVTTAAQAFTMHDYVAERGASIAARLRLVEYERLADWTTVERGTYVLTALDQLSSGMLRLVQALVQQLEGSEGVRFLNHPSRTMRRVELLHALASLGRNEFRAERVTHDYRALRFPVFLRSERDHGGAVSPLLHSSRDVDAAVARAAAQGFRLDDLLVIEFCDSADESGLYRKYGAFVVGDRVLARHVAASRMWQVKGRGTEDAPEIVDEDVAYIVENPHREALADIFRLAEVGYGRIDYSLKDGRIQTWEINLAPTIGLGRGKLSWNLPEELRRRRMAGRDHFFGAFQEAWERVDSVPAGPSIPVTLADQLRREALAREDHRGLIGRVRAKLGPLDRIVKPIGVRALPVLAWLATRAARRRAE